MDKHRLVSPSSFCWNPDCPDYGNITKFGILRSPSLPKGHLGMFSLVGRAQQPGCHSPSQRYQGRDSFGLAEGGSQAR